MAQITNIVVYSSVLFRPGGLVRSWAHHVQTTFTGNARLLAPLNKRSNKGRSGYPRGALKASIHGDVDPVGSHQLDITISVDVPYATYVLHGTAGPIVSDGFPAKKMALPDNPGFGVNHKFVVRGQAANDFMAAAHRATARVHPSIGQQRDARGRFSVSGMPHI